jgi:hypothetical protein
MMETAENRLGDDLVAVANPMAGQLRRTIGSVRDPGAKARVRSAPIVMRDPLLKNAPQVTLVQRNHPVQAFAPNCANHSFAERVRGRRSHRRLEDRQTHCGDCPVDTLGVYAVVIVDKEAVRLVAGHQHSELLRRPLRRRMFSHIPVTDPSSADLQHYKDVEHAERRRNRHKEIARQNSARVIAHERAPQLRPRPGRVLRVVGM